MPAPSVVVIGAGPQGLAAAAQLLEHGESPLVLEAGAGAAAAVAEWGHVRLFSDWGELVDDAAARLLAPTGWTRPAAVYPTAAEWIASYLAPLAAALGERVRYGSRVVGVERPEPGGPFTVRIEGGTPVECRALVDASGTWAQPGRAGADGRSARGEGVASARVQYRIPDFSLPGPFAGGHTVVLGSGHSAMAAIGGLAGLAEGDPRTRITWVRRGAVVEAPAAEGGALPARKALELRAQRVANSRLVEVVTGFHTESILDADEGVVLAAVDGRELPPADRVLVLTGFRPDLSFLSGLRLELDPALQAPAGLAAAIDPALHSCGTVAVTGAAELAQPESDLYIVGAKSYGRAPTFLAATGYAQVRSVAAAVSEARRAAALPAAARSGA